jgi:uncharacterized protein YndB with AHSA1/START domain
LQLVETLEATMSAPVDVDRTAPVLTELAIDIDAPREVVWKLHTEITAWPKWQHDISDARLDEPLARGASFHWAIHGMDITSTVYAIDEGSRILWGGDVNGITGIHEWTFTDTPSGVRLTTAESQSFAGDPVAADVTKMQALLDQALQSWLQQLKAAAETR